MPIDYLNTYNTYTNADLLQIIESPHAYKVEPIQAATQILLTRNVSEQDISEARIQLEAAEYKRKEKEEENAPLGLRDIFHPVFQLQGEIKPSKWIRSFLVIVFIQYAWTAFTVI